MAEHPIQSLMQTAMENIRDMVDVNTIIGEPVETPDGQVIIPVSKVGFGFAAGGSEFNSTKEEDMNSEEGDYGSQNERRYSENGKQKFPFGGGSGGGVSITPVAFIVVGEKGIRLLNMDGPTHLYDRIIDVAPAFLEQLKKIGKKRSIDMVEE